MYIYVENSLNRMKGILLEIDNIKSTFPDAIINEICAFAQGRIICCADCQDKDFHIDLDEDIGKKHIFCPVLTRNDMDDIIDTYKTIHKADLYALKFDINLSLCIGYTYIILCENCYLNGYCNNVKCRRPYNNDIHKFEQCQICKGVYCDNCSANWVYFIDNKITCTKCEWMIKNNIKERIIKINENNGSVIN